MRQQRGHRLLLALVGDSLLEPFWPEGTGIGRGFLGVLDTAWMVRRFCLEGEGDRVYEVIREREKLYSLLRWVIGRLIHSCIVNDCFFRQTTDSRLKGHFHRWTIDPVSRWGSRDGQLCTNCFNCYLFVPFQISYDQLPLQSGLAT